MKANVLQVIVKSMQLNQLTFFPQIFFNINLKPKLHKFYLETPDFHLKYKY